MTEQIKLDKNLNTTSPLVTFDYVANALALIRDASKNNTASTTTLSLNTYLTAKITGVTSSNIKSINSALNTQNIIIADGNNADVQLQIQTVVDSYNKILFCVGKPSAFQLTSADYLNIGVNIRDVVNDPESLRLLNDMVSRATKTSIDSVSEIDEIAKGIKTIMDVAAGNTENITPDELFAQMRKLGLISYLTIDKNVLFEIIKNEPDSGETLDTVNKLMFLVENIAYPKYSLTIATILLANDNLGNVQGTLKNGDITDDDTPTLVGKLSANLLENEKLKIFDENGLVGIATVNGTNWSFTLPKITVDGWVKYKVAVSNKYGEKLFSDWFSLQISLATAPDSLKILEIIDNTAPQIGTISNGGYTNDTTPEVKISLLNAKAGQIVQLYDGTAILGENRVVSDSDIAVGYLLITTPELINGKTYNINVKVSNPTGSISKASDVYTITIDTISSAPTINTIAGDNIINASEVTSAITGSSEANATINLSIGANTRTVTSDKNGNWSYSLISADITSMGQGTKIITATATDSAGNISLPTSKTIFIDTVVPSAPVINTIAGDNIINASEQTSIISGTCESGTSVLLTIGGNKRNAIVSGTNWSYTLISADITSIGQGSKTISATQTDSAGNVSLVATKTITIDTVAPVFTSGTSVSVAENVSTSTTVYQASATDASSITYSLVGGADYTKFNINTATGAVSFRTSPDYEVPIDSGANNIYDFTVRATDTAGNYTDKAVSISVSDVYEKLGGRAGDAIINLGEYGNLIVPIYVGGKCYYFWDRNGNKTADSGDGTNHNVLDDLFNKDIYGKVNTTVKNYDGNYGTTDVYRYTTLYGVKLALPTQGVYGVPFDDFYNLSSKDLPDNQSTYTDLAQIWDRYNSGVHTLGAPNDWSKVASYWSSTPSPQGHSFFYVYGMLGDLGDWSGGYVALQVLPVTIDLDGDGTISYTQKIMDVNSDGVLDKTAWVDKNDGVLVWDKYHDGKIHDSSQYELSQYGGKTDLEGLATGFDSNHDGIFDAKDEKFFEFSIWQDLNNDGISQNGEVKTLAQWGISTINLTSDKIIRTDEIGVKEDGRSIATKTDGSEVVIADAGFNYSSIKDISINTILKTYLELNEQNNSKTINELVDINSWTNSANTTPLVIYNLPIIEEEKQATTI